jgi:tartrate dehydratase alpha subunit/fumarate hydratase class I-like protein
MGTESVEPRAICAGEIVYAVERLCIEANCRLPEENLKRLEACATEESELRCQVLDMILENRRLAAREWRPACQDTGLTVGSSACAWRNNTWRLVSRPRPYG